MQKSLPKTPGRHFLTKQRLPVFRVTPHSVRRCHEVTEETAAVGGSCGAGEGLLVTKVYL